MSPPTATRIALLRLLADGHWHSGRELAGRLELTRAAVCKQAQALADWGVSVHTERARGYRLAQALDLLDPARLQDGLARVGVRDAVELFDTLPSTNAHLMTRISRGCGGGMCLAEHQTAGRGRRGRAWHSPFGRNLYLSIGQAYEGGAAALVGLSLAIGAALAQLLSDLGVPGVGIKWPNDLLCDGRKLGGILIELQGDTQGPCWVVAGVGLNVNMHGAADDAIDQPWTSLAQLTGRDWDRTALAVRMISTLRQVMSDFPAMGLAHWQAVYDRFDVLAGRPVDVDWAGERIRGVACGIDSSGALLVDDGAGRRALWGGEVTVRARGGSAV